MQNLIFTQLSIPEVRQIFREELDFYFKYRHTGFIHQQPYEGGSSNGIKRHYLDDTIIEDIYCMSVGLYNGLKGARIHTVGEARGLKKDEFLRFRNLGIKRWRELQSIIHPHAESEPE